jgi:hypothetical protein
MAGSGNVAIYQNPGSLTPGFDATPWRAVQYAAIDTLIRTEKAAGATLGAIRA